MVKLLPQLNMTIEDMSWDFLLRVKSLYGMG
jgi:hypothetical protein